MNGNNAEWPFGVTRLREAVEVMASLAGIPLSDEDVDPLVTELSQYYLQAGIAILENEEEAQGSPFFSPKNEHLEE